MKKILIIEIVLLALVLTLFAGILGYAHFSGALAADTASETAEPVLPSLEISQAQEAVDTSWMEGISTDRPLAAQQYFVYDLTNETFLTSSHSADTRIYPASITKLMTALIAMEYLDPAEIILAGDELDMIDPDSSVADIEKGDSLTAVQLVEAMLLPSGNDAAHVIAAAAGRRILSDPFADARTAVAAFVETMNLQAPEMGMTDSHFVNPDGIHGQQHYMTIQDLTVLGRLSLENVIVRGYAGLAEGNNPSYDEENTADDAPRQWFNTNALLHENSSYYCPYALGLKTGQTDAAGACLLSAFAYRGNRYLVGVFKCEESGDRFEDTLQLFLECVVKR